MAEAKATVCVRDVRVTYSRTFNLGDYNSAKLEVSISADVLDGGQSLDETMSGLWETAKTNVKAMALPLLHEAHVTNRRATEEFYLGLPEHLRERARAAQADASALERENAELRARLASMERLVRMVRDDDDPVAICKCGHSDAHHDVVGACTVAGCECTVFDPPLLSPDDEDGDDNSAFDLVAAL